MSDQASHDGKLIRPERTGRMTRFKITYRDPETGQMAEHIGDYKDTPGVVTRPDGTTYDTGPISAREWAEDHAYMLSDKAMGDVKIEEVAQ